MNSKAPPPPTLVRPHVSRSLLSLTTALPITYSENSSVRHVYKTMMIGSHIQLIMLDLRSGRMGKEQAKWLKETLESSSALWKIVLSGLPVGVEIDSSGKPMGNIDDQDNVGVASSRHRAHNPLQMEGTVDNDIYERTSKTKVEKNDFYQKGTIGNYSSHAFHAFLFYI